MGRRAEKYDRANVRRLSERASSNLRRFAAIVGDKTQAIDTLLAETDDDEFIGKMLRSTQRHAEAGKAALSDTPHSAQAHA